MNRFCYFSKNSVIRFSIILIAVLLHVSFQSCEKEYSSDYSDDTTNNYKGSEDQADYNWSESEIIDIQLNGSSVSCSSDKVTINGSSVRITSAATYRVAGTLNDGQIIVSSPDENIVRIILNGANISCSNSAPIYIKNASKVMIALADGTVNTITDKSGYVLNEDNEPSAAVFSKSYLSFYGTGTISVTGNYKDGIVSKDGLVIKSGTINVKAVDDGIRGKDFVVIHGGAVSVVSGGDAIKSDNDTDTDRGYINIESGDITVNATAGDGISAQNVISIKDGNIKITTGGGAAANTSNTNTGGFPGQPSPSNTQTISKKAIKAKASITMEKGTVTTDSYDDSFHTEGSVTINGGNVTISSGDDAIHAVAAVTINGDVVNILKSYEAIESALITVNGGIVTLNSTDDAFNATKGQATETNDGSLLLINGGTIMVSSTTGDGMDSNGNVTVTGGTIVVQGPKSQPEVGFDINGTFNINGGFVIGSGPNAGMMIEGAATSSAQNSILATVSATVSTSTFFHIQNSSGQDLVTFKPVRTQYYFVFSSSQLKSGETYSIYTGGSHTGTSVNGYYRDGTYSGGTLKKTFTLSSRVTNISM
jgi:hypothetical protein